MQPPASFQPAVRLGCSVEEAFRGMPSHALADHLKLFSQERFLLVWDQDRGRLVLKQGSQPRDEIRALWQVGPTSPPGFSIPWLPVTNRTGPPISSFSFASFFLVEKQGHFEAPLASFWDT